MKVTCNIHCLYEKNTGELYYPSKGKYSKGNTQECNSKVGVILDGLPISLGHTQHEQIRHQQPSSVPKIDHLHYDREQEQNTQQKVVGHMKAKFAGIADIVNGEF